MFNDVVLITAVGGDIGQSIIKCLKPENRKLYFLGCDSNYYAAGKDEVDEFLVAPLVKDNLKYFHFIQGIIKKYKIRYIYPATEAEIMFFSFYREYFKKRGITVFINNPFILNIFFDKYKTVKFLEKNGIFAPRTFLMSEYRNQLGYPLILKPRFGSGGKSVVKINNKEELNFYRNRIPSAIAQEYLSGKDNEYTTGIFSDGSHIRSITFRRVLGFGGVSSRIELSTDSGIMELAKKIAERSNLFGSINAQSKKTSKGFIVFEINPRFSSTVYFRHHFGFQDVKWWFDIIHGNKTRYALKYKKGVIVRALTEKFFDFSRASI